jgi:hypothetical protein
MRLSYATPWMPRTRAVSWAKSSANSSPSRFSQLVSGLQDVLSRMLASTSRVKNQRREPSLSNRHPIRSFRL